MAFTPLTTVLFLTGVPLNNTYKDTLTFADAVTQEAYFRTKIHPNTQVYNNLTYQREERYIAAPVLKDALINCNYLMFQNSNYTGKWFYAFVTRTEYKNENTTWVYFEVDPFQTYAFDYTVKQCFVEREHVTDDSVGANLIDEGLALGDFVCNSIFEKFYKDWWIVAGHTIEPRSPYGVVSGKYYGKIFSGVRYYCYGSPSSFGAMLDELETAGKLDGAITEVFMLPKDIVSPNQGDAEELQQNPEQVFQWNVPGLNSTTLDGYTPRNKKLLTYPYKFCNLSNLAGQETQLRYEFMSYEAGQLWCFGSIIPSGKILCFPAGYKGIPDNVDEGISLGNYPTCSWVSNVYANWMAQQNVVTAMSMSGAVIQGGMQALMTGNLGGALTSTTMNALSVSLNDMKDGVTHSFSPASAKGLAGGEVTSIGRNAYGFRAKEMSITKDYAKSIDDFFTAFGYKVNKVKVPNINTRPSFNFVKTVDAKIIGKMPQPAIDIIVNAFNNGITFWHGDWVGDYSRAN